ncbi:MarR family transcriptional regulator [Ligilactobacillus saerimneri]|uniref:MarR family transcriptional regulator n=1 Tax=Ligilactobacillus saerimneri TaxID=228229 RepID=UPI0024B18795|nr:MarR family transcriptional regulator [Ligilactobacillus saerimneri]MDI9206576.1 MarR family transcriptional regulator [Ligilactobacillus saerimneri]
MRINDLSIKLKLSQSATSRMLTRFENTCGVITRKKDEQDKRSVRISLTSHGQDLLAQAQAKLAQLNHNQSGDPELVGQAIITLAQMGEMPR